MASAKLGKLYFAKECTAIRLGILVIYKDASAFASNFVARLVFWGMCTLG